MTDAADFFFKPWAYIKGYAKEKNNLTEDLVKQVQARLPVHWLDLKYFDRLFSLLSDKQSKLDV